MKYKLNYGHSVSAFPSAVLDVLDRAGLCDLRVLMYMCSTGAFDLSEISKNTGFDESEIKSSLAFWRGAGIISEVTESADKPSKSRATKSAEVKKSTPKREDKTEKNNVEPLQDTSKKLSRQEGLPSYTSDELSDILEKRKDTALLINECQNIMGKVFNVREVNIIIGLVDYLGLDGEYIMLLLKYCVDAGKKTLHFAEKTAFSLYDSGITDASALAEEFRRREAAASVEGKIRKMFGIGSRALTSREKKEISAWINEMNFSVDIIEKAYEVTVDATGNGSMHYTNSVLERWFAEGLNTIEAVEQSYKKSKSESDKGDGGSSFDTDEFFAAAVRRSMAEE